MFKLSNYCLNEKINVYIIKESVRNALAEHRPDLESKYVNWSTENVVDEIENVSYQ